MYFEDLQNTVFKNLKGQDFDPLLEFEADFTSSKNSHFDPLKLRNICVQMETHPKSAKNLWIKILEHMTANLRNKVSVLNQFGVSV